MPAAPGQGQRKHLEPHLPSDLKSDLVRALKAAYEELSNPPSSILHDEAKVRAWKPRVKRTIIDWDLLTSADGFSVDDEPTALDTDKDKEGDSSFSREDDKSTAHNFLSIGLIGSSQFRLT